MTEAKEAFTQHNARMKRVKTALDKMQARKTSERGLLIVHTGNDKGKSSSAFGMAIRSIGWDMMLVSARARAAWKKAKAMILHLADLGIEFEEVKHPFMAQKGVEY